MDGVQEFIYPCAFRVNIPAWSHGNGAAASGGNGDVWDSQGL